eukprot:GHVR01033751.1.p1 GENE.GHVR01033751.1~~GHVR01033751.1.p1  ORF type:complete len:308 (+),score=14.93 GHVR01033751.1:180-1103(+)
MPCYKPLKGWRSQKRNPTGKHSIVFSPKKGFIDQPIEVPCGQCIGCRLERSRQWAIRCVHEASLHEDNVFITLTFADNNLDPEGSLQKEDFQKFMKRLRRKFPHKIRYYHCGEYGAKYARPHHHACLFNHKFPDQILERHTPTGFPEYSSKILDKLWGHGRARIGTVTFESAAYVARYITKKITGEAATTAYCNIDHQTGEIISERLPEYTTMSRRPGIAKNWFDKYKSDVYPSDEVIIKGKKMMPPKYYDSQYEIVDPENHSLVKAKRKASQKQNAHNNTPERLSVRETIQLKKAGQLIRSYENET